MPSRVDEATGLSDPHVLKALDYCRQVVTGTIPACKWVRLACQRQIDDLKRAHTAEGWPYYFDEGKAGRAARFLEQLPHFEGPLAGQLMVLEPWQCFIVTTFFGWRRKSNGFRRFRRAYIEVPRGNGKSFLASGIYLYALAADNEAGAQVYSAATTRKQARVVHEGAEKILAMRSELKKRLGLRVTAHAISQHRSRSRGEALSREAKNQDGANIHCAVVDELHAHKSRAVWDVIVTGAGKRPQSFIWTITTAGTDSAGICYEVRGDVVRMLDGAANEQLFGIIYTIDAEDDWRSEAAWEKANPNWHVSIDLDLFRMNATEAMQSASKENNFKTKHLNVWCGADVAWMQMDAWDACADTTLRAEDFAGEQWVEGLDLASKVDVAAAVGLAYRDVPAEKEGAAPVRHYYLFPRFYLPEGAVERSKNSQYEGWVKDGHLTTTEGDVIDFDVIKADLRSAGKAHKVNEVAFDPWQAQQLANEMQAEGLTMVELKPTVQNFSEPMKELEALVLTGRLHHNGNPVMRWMVGNVVCHRDAKENIYPRKEKVENKIDGAVATIMALNRALLAPPAPEDPYKERGFLTL